MSKKSFRIALAVVVGSLAILGIVAIYFVNKVQSYPSERKSGTGAEVLVAIEPGMNFPAIAERLHQKGVVDEPRWFRLYAMHRGVTTKVRVGEYKLKDNMTPEEVRAAVALASDTGTRRPLLEVSGGITRETVRAYAQTGADCISVGAVTNSAPVLDIGLDIEVSP